ncbi:DUF3953 domain-containing protein [Paenibacillus kribbensis]|uniref:DUF3953 domain-containing protein n=1 Tax=Paenibacillus kribbensis TaxID=172713 RepID=UPI000839830F|nr:DUF3953 domain-containing protein [Paenibacillus kribbensis]
MFSYRGKIKGRVHLSMFKKMDIYRILTLISALMVVILSSLSLAFPDTYKHSYTIAQFFLGILFLFSGISELKAKRNHMAIASFIVSFFTFFVFIFRLMV